MPKAGLAHCGHHDKHWEFCYDFDGRVNFIKRYKPTKEQDLRLKLFGLVPEDMIPGKNSVEWGTYCKAREAYDKTREACNKAWETCDQTREAYAKTKEACNKAWETCDKTRETYVKTFGSELDAIHTKLWPDCPYDNDKSTIFTRKNEKGEWC